MMNSSIFLTGMFRSGTTLMSKILSAHPAMLVVSDPYIYFLKAYRNFLYEQYGGIHWHPDEPMSDYFCDKNYSILEKFSSMNFSEKIPPVYKEKIKNDIVEWKREQHPRLCEKINEVDGDTFRDFYNSLIDLLFQLYGDAEMTMCGTKAGWSEDLIPALHSAFPSMKCIIMVRDIRSIIASQNSKQGRGEGKRPLLFYIRQWRKSVAFAKMYSEIVNDMVSYVHVIRYEDFVKEPKDEIVSLCNFLHVPFHAHMLDASKFKDETIDALWEPNTSYDANQGIYLSSIDKWQSILSQKEIQMIETLAGPELQLMGYSLTQEKLKIDELFSSLPEPPVDEIVDWIKPFSCCDYLKDVNQLYVERDNEQKRLKLLECCNAPQDRELIRRYFINEHYYEVLRTDFFGDGGGFSANGI